MKKAKEREIMGFNNNIKEIAKFASFTVTKLVALNLLTYPESCVIISY